MIPAPSWRPTNGAYHRSPGWSSSAIRLFEESPALFKRRYLDGIPEPETAAMAIGSAVGWLIQDAAGEAIDEKPRVMDVGRGTKRWKATAEAEPDRLLVTEGEMRTARRTAAAILEPIRGTAERPTCAEVARQLLVEMLGISEWAHRWDEQGLEARCKIDRGVALVGGPCVVELKTWAPRHGDSSPEAFAAVAVRDGHDLQAAWNRRGLAAACGVRPDHVVVAVTTVIPHEVLVRRMVPPPGTYDADLSAWEDDAERRIDAAVDGLKAALADTTGAAWRQPWETLDGPSAPALDRPRWARRA